MIIVAVVFVLCVFAATLGWRWRKLIQNHARVLLTGGGTGGHVYPALAIADGIKQREPDAQFLYVGVAGKAEAVIVPRAKYPLRFVTSIGFPGFRPSPALLRFVLSLIVGMMQSSLILVRFCPRWIIATGGYASAPIVLSAVLLRWFKVCPAKIFIHEQNSVPGQLNAVLGRWADRVLLTFPQTRSFFPNNGVVVGYPVRYSIAPKSRSEAIKSLDFEIPPNRKVVFIFGGSQGARTINRAVIEALNVLFEERHRIFIIHGVGLARAQSYHPMEDTVRLIEKIFSRPQRDELKTFYHFQDYFHNIADIYSVSDLIVCRSGAGSLNEICQLGKPALLIPKSNLPGDHQVMNARAMKAAGAAEILFEETGYESGKIREKVDGRLLAHYIMELLGNEQQLEEMGKNSRNFLQRRANGRILSELYGDQSYDNGRDYAKFENVALWNNQRLLDELRSAYLKNPVDYDPLAVIGSSDDLDYYRHKAEGLLAHEKWPSRNLGVKLVGLTRHTDKVPMLLHILQDRTPAPRVQRIFGGDFEQVAFIRRNIVTALKVLNVLNEEVEIGLLAALEDPYYEVRAEACRAIIHFGPLLGGKESFLKTLIQSISDRSFEVSAEAAKAVGEIGVDGRAVTALLNLKEHHNWQVRNAALHGIKRLLERRVIVASTELLTEIDRFILTAPHFVPRFSIQETYRAILQYARK